MSISVQYLQLSGWLGDCRRVAGWRVAGVGCPHSHERVGCECHAAGRLLAKTLHTRGHAADCAVACMHVCLQVYSAG